MMDDANIGDERWTVEWFDGPEHDTGDWDPADLPRHQKSYRTQQVARTQARRCAGICWFGVARVQRECFSVDPGMPYAEWLPVGDSEEVEP